MNRFTTLALLLAVVGLGLAIWLQTEREGPLQPAVERPLFEGLVVEDLTRIRIDNIDRSIHLSIDRDTGGRWFLTDPIAYPARREMLVQLLGVLARNQAWIVPDGELEDMQAALSKPRAVLELREERADGTTRTRRLEMGPVDVDGMRINARLVEDGERTVLRASRSLEVPLETSVLDWRSRKVFDIRHDEVVELRRAGYDPLPTGPVELDLAARREGAGWWLDRPLRLQADPGFMRNWTAVLTAIRVRHFHSDVPDPDLAAYGLDPPAFSLTLVDRLGREETLEVGKPLVGSTYFCRRSNGPHVWELELQDFSQLFLEPDKLFDRVLVRLPREMIENLRVRGLEWDVRLTQDLAPPRPRWTVAWKPAVGSGDWTAELPAEREVVERALALLGRDDTIAAYLWHTPREELFPPEAPVQAIWAESGGLRHGGRLGPPYVTPAGTSVRTWLRERESAVSLVPQEVGELVALAPEEFVSTMLVELREASLSRIEVSTGDLAPRLFRKTIKTTWVHHDLETDAGPELGPVIEHLFFLRAEHHVPRGEEQELLELVRVRIQDREGTWTQFEVGRTPAGEVRARLGSRQSVLRHAQLHADLLEIARKAD